MTGIAGEPLVAVPPAVLAAPADQGAPDQGASSRRRWRTAVKIVIVVGASVAAYFALRHRLPSLSAVAGTVRTADHRWIAVAVLAEAVSLAMFAAQQRRLLGAFDVRMSPPRALAVTLSRSAIAVALPAGSAVSAGFAFQQYRQRGASRPTATTVLILSALASTVGLALLYLGGVSTVCARWLGTHWAGHSSAILLGAVAVLLVALAPVLWWLSRGGADSLAGVDRLASAERLVEIQVDAHLRARRQRGARDDEAPAWLAWVRRGVTPLATAVRDARAVPAKHWVFALGYAVANWLLDLVCLIAVARACHLDLGLAHLAATYLAVQLVRQLPITPGGIGLIETSLLAGLVSAGAAQAPAAAVVLGYRLLSCWLVIPLGLVTWLGLRLPAGASAPEDENDSRPGIPAPRERRSPSAQRELRRGYGRRLSRLRGNSGPGGVRRPRQRQPH